MYCSERVNRRGALVFQVANLLQADGITGNYPGLLTDVLTLVILVELSRSLFEYLSWGHVAVYLIVDAGILFVTRHLMIELFNHNLNSLSLMDLGLILIAMGFLRVCITGVSGFGFASARQSSNTRQKDTVDYQPL